MQWITSHENHYVKQLLKLQQSAQFRRKSGATILDGVHLIHSYLSAYQQPTGLKSIAIGESGKRNKEITSLINTHRLLQKTKGYFIADNIFKKISPVKSPTGILACITIPNANDQAIPITHDSDSCILLESIQDPGNLGSMIRSAAAASITTIYLSKECTDVWSPKTLRAAMGAHFFLNIFFDCNLIEIANHFQGQVIATSPHAPKTLFQSNLTQPTAFIFGNEGTGLSTEIQQVTDEIITIPMPGRTESLNAASAVAICLFEKVRQEQQIGHYDPQFPKNT